MDKTVTVDQAISKGRMMITYPMAIIFLGIPLAALWASDKFGYPQWIIGIALPGGALLSMVYCYFVVNKWRIWAFTNVEDVNTLQQKAIAANLLFDDKSFWGKLMLRSPVDKQAVAALKTKFDKPEKKVVEADDPMVPAETTIYFSKGDSIALFVVMICVIGVGIYLCAVRNYFFGAILIIGAGRYCFTGYSEAKKAIKKIPQIIINDKGIETVTTPFHPWKSITGEEAITEVSGTGSNTSYFFYLVYKYPGGSEKIDLSDLTTDSDKMEHLLKIYRLRGDKNS